MIYKISRIGLWSLFRGRWWGDIKIGHMLSNQKIEMYIQIFTKNRMFSDSRNESQTPSNNAAV